jgi:nitric oxide reductase NorQ protein
MSKIKKINPEQFLGEREPTAEFFPEAGVDFVITPYVQDLTDRALAYLSIGYAVHLSGPAGTGKSTLAMHIASQLGQHCTLLHGDDEFKASDLLGRDTGYRRNSVVDNYVSSIVKTEESLSVVWSSNRLTTACQKGHTLIYDEFTRSPATANNPFLSILEEGILNIPSSGKEKGYIKVHPNFRAIFTSNPEEYVGVHKTQDALLDRMITLRLDYQDRETEAAIVCAKSNRTLKDAESIVDVIRTIRDRLGNMNGPTVRSAIAIARIVDYRKCQVDPKDPLFLVTCGDVLYFHTCRHPTATITQDEVDSIIKSLGKPSPEKPATGVEPNVTRKTLRSQEDLQEQMTENTGAKIVNWQPPVDSELETKVLQATQELTQVFATQCDPVPAPKGSSFPASLPTERNAQPSTSVQAMATPPASMVLTKPCPASLIERETASTLQMLEAVVSRFPKPPAGVHSSRHVTPPSSVTENQAF